VTAAKRVYLLLTALLILPIGSSAGDEDLDGLPIVAIHFERFDVFDTSQPKTSYWPYRWANALHIVSKEEFLRSMILFAEGDPFSARVAAESARILRSLGFINPVEIYARRVEGGVEVFVETHDRWSLKVGANLGIFGSRSTYSLDLEEDNLLGWGKTVKIAYESDEERTSWSYRYVDPNVFSSRWRLRLEHKNHSDGSRDEVRIDRPFYSLATPWSWGFEGLSEKLTEHLYSQSESVVQGNHDSEKLRVWGGARLPGNGDLTRRLVGGWVYSRDQYFDWEWIDGAPYPTPEDRLIEGPTLAIEQVADRFQVVKGFRAWVSQEDVALGPNYRFSTTFSHPSFGGDRQRLLLAGEVHAAGRRGRWLILGDAWLAGRVESGETRNVVAGAQVGAAQLGHRGWQFRLYGETSHKLDLDRQLTLGADRGLRGWDPDYFDGTGRAVLNVQWRTLLKEEVLGLFSVGVVIFGDAGATWAPRVGADTGGVRVDAGAGLLFDLAHLGRTSLLRVDIAFPDDGSGPTFTLSTSSIF
jgi:hypothetical protein